MPDTLLEILITIGIIIMVFNLFILFLGIGYGLVKGKRLDPTTSFKLKIFLLMLWRFRLKELKFAWMLYNLKRKNDRNKKLEKIKKYKK